MPVSSEKPIDFENMTTDELREEMPERENRWEFKDASYLEIDNCTELLKELSKQTSAFANSHGGYLVFGVKKDDLSFQECQTVYRSKKSPKGEPMEEWLAKRVRMSVEYPLFGAKVHRVNFTNDKSKAVFVIEYPDSEKAPHQANDNKYYWRTNFTSDPAPHYYLEMVRNRPSKATLEVDITELRMEGTVNRVGSANRWEELLNLTFQICASVTNTSFVTAEGWCVHVQCDDSDVGWKIPIDYELKTDASIRPDSAKGLNLYPEEKRDMWIEFQSTVNLGEWRNMSVDRKYEAFCHLRADLKPASHNFVGSSFRFDLNQIERLADKAKMEIQHFKILDR